jgi:pimeloyl-ACP methyl ester carboxylesterase
MNIYTIDVQKNSFIRKSNHKELPDGAFFYLHGLASSPQSQKAQFFKQCFVQQGLSLQIPDFNQNDFFHLSLTRQIQQLQTLLSNSPVTLLGSSLGGLTALWAAEQFPQIQRLVLFAPALNFLTHCIATIGEAAFAQWHRERQFTFYHYAQQREQSLSYAFIEDIQQYQDANLQRRIPTLILHGRFDNVISIQAVRDFATTRPWIQLIELDSDHGLNDVQPLLWQATQQFLFD